MTKPSPKNQAKAVKRLMHNLDCLLSHFRPIDTELAADLRDDFEEKLIEALSTQPQAPQGGVVNGEARDVEAVFESQAIAAYEASGGTVPWTHLKPGEPDKWRKVVIAVHAVTKYQKGQWEGQP